MASGEEAAVDVAGPVSPVFVAEDGALAAPELPDRATGYSLRLAPPPLPPLASTWAMESPPRTLPMSMWELGPLAVMSPVLALPPRPEVASLSSPPRPPWPPMTRPRTLLLTLPVVPDSEVAVDWAPELAFEVAVPSTRASPVRPVAPLLPELMPTPPLAERAF